MPKSPLLTRVCEWTLHLLTFFHCSTRRVTNRGVRLGSKPIAEVHQAQAAARCTPVAHQPLFVLRALIVPDPRAQNPGWHTGLHSRRRPQSRAVSVWSAGWATRAQNHSEGHQRDPSGQAAHLTLGSSWKINQPASSCRGDRPWAGATGQSFPCKALAAKAGSTSTGLRLVPGKPQAFNHTYFSHEEAVLLSHIHRALHLFANGNRKMCMLKISSLLSTPPSAVWAFHINKNRVCFSLQFQTFCRDKSHHKR